MKTIVKSIRSGGSLLLSVVCVMLLCNSEGIFAVNPKIASSQRECMTIIVGQSQIVKAPWPAIRVSVTDPKVANVQLLTPDQILVQGIKTGSTDLILWNRDETTVWQSCVYVSLDIEQYQQKLYSMFPHASLQLEQSADVLIIKGLLRSADEAVQLHKYLEKTGTAYVDMTSVAGTQQVKLDIRVAEVSRTAIRALGFNTYHEGTDNFFGDYFFGIRPSSTSAGEFGLDVTAPGSTTVLVGFHSDWLAFIRALAENQYLRILANPTLVALSGEEASFLAGGEYPIPVVQGGVGGTSSGTSVTIEYKEYGVRLSFRPIVLGDGTIRLYTAPEVSDLTDVGSVTIEGFEIPALRTRKFETTLELKSGQTFAMAGLIKRNNDAINSRVPGLGDLPVLGALFRSVRYTRGETEMVVLVTATLVEPLNLAETPPLPGFLDEEPNDWELYVEGRIEGKGLAKISPTDAAWLREMGIDKLIGPGAWENYENLDASD